MKWWAIWAAAGMTYLAAALGEDIPLPAEIPVPAEKPSPSNKPPPSANSVSITAQIIEAGTKNERPDRWSGLLNVKDQKRRNVGGPKSKQLFITLARMCKDDLGELRVQWRLYASDVQTHKTDIVGSNEVSIALTNLTPQSITTEPPITITYTPGKVEYSNNPGGNNNNIAASRVIRASGQRMTGWAVQVFQDTTLVGEKYSDPGLKSGVEKKEPPKSSATTMGIRELPTSTSTTMGIVPKNKNTPIRSGNFK